MRADRLGFDEATANLLEAERFFFSWTQSVSSSEALRLAHRHGCSSYDAEFVVLAKNYTAGV